MAARACAGNIRHMLRDAANGAGRAGPRSHAWSASEGEAPRLARSLDLESLAAERAAMLDRMQRLRDVLPSFARETERARSQAARLRVENKRLVEQVRALQARLERSSLPGHR